MATTSPQAREKTSSPSSLRPEHDLPAYSKTGSEVPPRYDLEGTIQDVITRTEELPESGLDILAQYDTVLVVDDSSSMNTGARWRQTSDALQMLAEVVTRYDKDGVDIHFLNARPRKSLCRQIRSAKSVMDLFASVQPSGATPMAEALNRILRPYIRQLEAYRKQDQDQPHKKLWGFGKSKQAAPKKLNVLVITDGVPDSHEDVEENIRRVAKVLNDGEWPHNQLGIQFVQVGKSERAKAWLQKLDDDSKSVIDGRRSSLFARDIIDTRPFDGQQLTPKLLLEVLCGAIHRQTDREGADHWLDEAPIKTDWHSKKGPKEC